MDTMLYLARHGETDWNRQGRYQGQLDIPLNTKGREQARALADSLTMIGPGAIWASDLCRARETAEIVALPHQLPVLTHPGLREMDFGEWQGLTWQEVEASFPQVWPRWIRDPASVQIPKAEGVEALESRFNLTLQGICTLYPGQKLIVVSHGGPIGRFLAALGAQEFWMMQGNCACHILNYRQNRFHYYGPCQD